MTCAITNVDDTQRIDKLLSGIDIPACPDILVRLQRLLQDPSADLGKVADLVASDVAVSAGVIKVANSPLSGLSRRLQTVQHAVPVLGTRAIAGVVAGITLRSTLDGGGGRMDRFWDTTRRVAAVCRLLSRELRGVPQEIAYTFGLFHDCGIPILMRRFPDYRETLIEANAVSGRRFTEVEDARHATNHAVVGYFLARNWGLADEVSQAIRYHHDFAIFDAGVSAEVARSRTLVAIGALANRIVRLYLRLSHDPNWEQCSEAVLLHLGLDDKDFVDLSEQASEALEADDGAAR